jgi:hypothetical protein
MRLQLFRYECAPYRHKFESPSLAAAGYGLFLLRSDRSDHLAFLDALSDPVFLELEAILLEFKAFNEKDSRGRAKLLHEAFGVTCDPSEDGESYNIVQYPRCPVCGTRQMHYWEVIEPPIFVDIEVPSVEHKRWAALTATQKRRLVSAALGQISV